MISAIWIIKVIMAFLSYEPKIPTIKAKVISTTPSLDLILIRYTMKELIITSKNISPSKFVNNIIIFAKVVITIKISKSDQRKLFFCIFLLFGFIIINFTMRKPQDKRTPFFNYYNILLTENTVVFNTHISLTQCLVPFYNRDRNILYAC